MRPIPGLTDDLAEAALAASGWFARFGFTPHFPMTDAQAVEFLQRGGEYAVDEAQLADLVYRGIVTAPEDGLWNPAAVVQAGAMLEARRQFAVTPSLHDPKKNTVWLDYESAAAADNLDEFLQGKPRLDLRHLLILMTECDTRELREKLLSRLAATLQRDHGLTL